ncbi:MAG: LLM class flavin-dependent oxidoreductase, partial [Chloroflexota bacterium]
GLLPNVMGDDGRVRMGPPTLAELRAMKVWLDAHRAATTPFDIIVDGETPGDDRAKAGAMMREQADAGVTWWLESRWNEPRNLNGLQVARARIMRGPPRFEL